jgi:hypothetical protein
MAPDLSAVLPSGIPDVPDASDVVEPSSSASSDESNPDRADVEAVSTEAFVVGESIDAADSSPNSVALYKRYDIDSHPGFCPEGLLRKDYSRVLAEIVDAVVGAEWPVYQSVLYERVVSAHSSHRIGARIKMALDFVLRGRFRSVPEFDETLLVPCGRPVPGYVAWRDDSGRTWDKVPLIELVGLAFHLWSAYGSKEAVLQGMRKRFGMQKTSPQAKAKFDAAFAKMLKVVDKSLIMDIVDRFGACDIGPEGIALFDHGDDDQAGSEVTEANRELSVEPFAGGFDDEELWRCLLGILAEVPAGLDRGECFRKVGERFQIDRRLVDLAVLDPSTDFGLCVRRAMTHLKRSGLANIKSKGFWRATREGVNRAQNGALFGTSVG